MKKIFAIATLALALVASAFAATKFDPNGQTSFTEYSNGIQVANISNQTVDVLLVQPGFSVNLTLLAGQSTLAGSSSSNGWYEWTCPAPYNVVIQGTYQQPTYDNHNMTMSCR
jgi:opacity protein-like surface antigen